MPALHRIVACSLLLAFFPFPISIHSTDLQSVIVGAHISPTLAQVAAVLRSEGTALAPDTRSHVSARLASQLLRSGHDRNWASAVAALAGGGDNHALVARALVQDVSERLGAHVDWAAVARVAPLTRAQRMMHVDYPLALAAPSPNFWLAHRPHDLSINYVVIHDTESGCASALSTLTNPWSFASAHFLVCRDGRVFQFVPVADAAWHAGNTYINLHSIGIEHEGHVGHGYTMAQYKATAAILLTVNRKLHLNLQWTRNTVFGHENVPASNHTDPGSGWNWPLFMSLLRGGTSYTGGDPSLAVNLWPNVYVHSCASIYCRVLGTANWGEQFVVRDRIPGWVGIYYAGQQGWILSSATGSGSGTVVRVKARLTWVRAAPAPWASHVGLTSRGQAYATTMFNGGYDHRGWWFIEYAHRYGYLCACDTTPGFPPHISPTVTPTAIPTATNTATATPTNTSVPTNTPTATNTPVPTDTATSTPTQSPTVTLTPTSLPTITATPDTTPITATATVPATTTVTASPTP